jgi:MFS transporter, DHA1 family, multidrug resistance protein
MVGSSTVIRDLVKGNEVAKALSLMMLIFGVAPIIAPNIGGIIVSAFGWLYLFLALAVIALVVVLMISRVLRDACGLDTSVSLSPRSVALGYAAVLKEPHSSSTPLLPAWPWRAYSPKLRGRPLCSSTSSVS